MNIIIMGLPVQVKYCCENNRTLFLISHRDMFRLAIRNETDLGRQGAKAFMDQGELVLTK